MAELLPLADLMFEILLRLPVMSLLRFRCVCKGWRDLIDSRNFAKSHLNCLSNRPPSLLVLRHEHHSSAYNAYDIVDLSSVINGAPALAFKDHPFPADGRSAHYVGQCNGLVCIAHCIGRGALLWNPATRKQFVIEVPAQELWFRNWGFCYDMDSDDYKVVAVAEEEEASGAEGWYFVWVYSLRSHTWNRINDFPYFRVAYEEPGVFVNGALHWKVYQQESEVRVIGALHLGKLEYNLVSMPDYNSEDTDFEYLGVLDGRLFALYYDSDYDYFNLWTMNEYGVKESWTKLMRCANYAMGLISSAYLQNDEVLLFNPYLEDIKTGGCEFRTISIGRGHEIEVRSSGRLSSGYWPYVYVPSLVCPQNGW